MRLMPKKSTDKRWLPAAAISSLFAEKLLSGWRQANLCPGRKSFLGSICSLAGKRFIFQAFWDSHYGKISGRRYGRSFAAAKQKASQSTDNYAAGVV